MDHFLCHGSRCGYTDKYVSTLDHICQASFFHVLVGDLSHLLFLFVQSFTAFVDRTLPVTHDHIFQTHADQQFDDRDTGCTCSGSYYFDLINLLSDYFQRIDHGRHRYHCGSVLVIVEDRNITALF